MTRKHRRPADWPEDCDDRPGWSPEHLAEHLARKAKLRHPHTYAGIGEWWEAYRGFVPIQMAHGLSQVMKHRGVTFHEAWDILVGTGQIVMLEDVPGTSTDPEAADPEATDADGRGRTKAKSTR